MSTPETEVPARTGAAQDNPAVLDARLAGLPARAQRQLRDARRALENRHPREASELLQRAQVWAGDHPEFLRLVGIVRNLEGRPQDALAALRRALEKAPGDALILTNLGSTLRAAGEFDAAIVTLRRACDVAPDLAAAWFNLGRALGASGRNGEAHDAYANALRCDPAHVRARIGYGDSLRSFGRIADAAAEYRRALKLPGSMRAWTRLASMQSVVLTAEETAELERLFARPGLTENDRVTAGFALAKALETQGRYAEAFTVLSASNSVKRRQLQWDAHAFSQGIDAIMKAFATPPATASAATLGREVVFLVGMPRSGSTQVEPILSVHADVQGAVELPDLANILDDESRRTGLEFPRWVAQTNAEDWRRLGEEYLARTARWRRERPFFVDKSLSNWRLIGAAMAMLPGARVVNCRRDPLEACLACYRQLFSRGQAFTYDLAELAAYWRDYERAMRFWHVRYPGAIRDQVLETLQADRETEVRALLAFCGLPFDPTSLRVRESPRKRAAGARAAAPEPSRQDSPRAGFYGDLLAPLRLALGVR